MDPGSVERSVARQRAVALLAGLYRHCANAHSGVMEMMGEDLIDRYFILPLENHTANPWLLLAARSLGNPARSFAALMSFRWGWRRENRPGLFGENHTLRKELLEEYKMGRISAPFGPHTSDEKVAMNQAVEATHPLDAPIE